MNNDLNAQVLLSDNARTWAVFILIAVVAAILRLTNIDASSLSQDESTMLHFTRGLLEKGYPFLYRGASEVSMATYELVPYFIAPVVKLFGWSEYAVRLPAALFSMATLLLVFITTKSWFDRRVALFSALLYAVSPWSIYWSNNSFYPSQLQFFSMLSIVLVHRLFCSENVKDRDYYVLAAVLSATYLTWEGSGLLFLVYGFLGLIIFWNQWGFLRKGHAWISLGLLALVVVFQLVRRGLLKTPFLVTGSSRSSISSPQLAINQSTYDPFYYIENIFGSEQYIILSIVCLIGLLFLKRDRNLRFVYGYVFISIIVYTELLAVYAIRYVYFVLPMFLISVSASSFQLIDWITRTSVRSAMRVIRVISLVTAFVLLSFQTLVLSSDGLNLSGLRAKYQSSIAWELHPEVAGIDYRDVMLALKQRYRDGDIIITRSPFLLEAYTGLRGDYMLQNTTIGVVNYDPFVGPPYYLDKFVGNPVLRNKMELEDILYRSHRVWFLATPLAPTNEVLGEELMVFVHESMTLVHEASNVQLYLWEKNKVN